VLAGLPTPIDAFEARRIVLVLLLLSSCASTEVASGEVRHRMPGRGVADRRPAKRRRDVRPPRGC
jgi:hypothetical protein